MPKLPLQERWPKSASRSKDTSTTVVSCETLSKVDWYSRRRHDAHLYYYSDADEDGDGEGKAVSEADDEHEGDDRKEAGHHVVEHKEGKGNFDAHRHRGYGEGSFDHGHPLLPRFPPPSVYDKPSVVNPREAKKAERAPRTYPGAIPHSSNILPHSGILLPNYMNIHPGGGSSNSHAHHKGLASMKAATLIPSHIAGKASKAGRAFNDAVEPSSPKVTCLGRVKMNHKYRREMEKLAELQASVCPNVKTQLRTSKKGTNKEGRQPHSRGGPIAAVLSSAPAIAELKTSNHGSHREDITIDDPLSDSEAKVKKGIRKTLKEAKYHMKLHRDRKQSLLPNTSLASTCAAPHVEGAIDLGRFRSMEHMRGQEFNVPNTSTTLSVGDHNSHDAGCEPQVPPPNSLLLTRNSKSRAACATLNSSLSRTLADSSGYGVVVDGESNARRQAYLSLLKGSSYMHGTYCSLEVKDDVGELENVAMTNGHGGQGAHWSELNAKRLCEVVANECKPLYGRKNAMANRQASLPKATSEARLWQRRCFMKPSDLVVGGPIALQVNQPTTR
ncbi:hypothetical protein GOP47_0020418 [Adiantum capillus-veneris]|uniref:Uncharacterized protein n=1 Tax=Adiantum capillus-veneris TaxID=13818 RepID=A0A9D4Z817_ADICA|nr:hypothetical protein GOP47_0020418 [Adiantum capillus-veneris]